jgi:hypothetical protein
MGSSRCFPSRLSAPRRSCLCFRADTTRLCNSNEPTIHLHFLFILLYYYQSTARLKIHEVMPHTAFFLIVLCSVAAHCSAFLRR